MLNILKSTDRILIDTICVLVYGDPGAGKTSLGFSAASPLLLDFDRGAHRSGFRGDSVSIDSWADVQSMTADDFAGYETIVIDTVGRCLDTMALSLINDNPKLQAPAGQLTLQGWGALKIRFAAWLREIRSYGLDVVLIAHGEEKKDGDEIILRPDVVGSSYGEIFKHADGVAYLRMRGNQRVLCWNPQDKYVGKNPAELEPVEVPHLSQSPRYLAETIGTIKERIGVLSEHAQQVFAQVEVWRERIESAKSAKALTGLVEKINGDGNVEGAVKAQVKASIAARAEALGVAWDGAKFAKPKQEAAA